MVVILDREMVGERMELILEELERCGDKLDPDINSELRLNNKHVDIIDPVKSRLRMLRGLLLDTMEDM